MDPLALFDNENLFVIMIFVVLTPQTIQPLPTAWRILQTDVYRFHSSMTVTFLDSWRIRVDYVRLSLYKVVVELRMSRL